MKTIIFYDDAAMTRESIKYGIEKFELGELTHFLADPAEGRVLKTGFAYVDLPKEGKTSVDYKIQEYSDLGFLVKTKEIIEDGNFDVELSIDVLEVVSNGNVDIVVIYSDSNNLVGLVEKIMRKGIRVEIVSISKTKLAQKASSFIDLSFVLQGNDEDDEFEEEHEDKTNVEKDKIDDEELKEEKNEEEK